MIDQLGRDEMGDISTVVGCVWNALVLTFVKYGVKGGNQETMLLDQLEWAVKLIPTEKGMRYKTHSDWLVEQWQDMMGWKARGYQGLDRDACMPQWKNIIREVEERAHGMEVTKLEDERTMLETKILNAMVTYGVEGMVRLEEDLTTPVDGYRQPGAPWS
jgi:hypothetical protein